MSFGTFVVFSLSATAGTVVKLSGSAWHCFVSGAGSLIASLGCPMFVFVGDWNRLIPVPWKEPVAVVLEGLWSRLSTAPTVKSPRRSCGGHTTPSFWVCKLTAVAS